MLAPLTRLPDFIAKTGEKINELDRDFLYREEFVPFLANYNDYLRISCQLGLIDNLKEEERYKHYYPTKFAKKMSEKRAGTDVKQIIRDSILDIVKKQNESKPEERHAILLLWYFLTLKKRGITPEEHHFQLAKDKRNSYFPRIRLTFAESLEYFLFGDNEDEAIQFLNEWEKLM